MSTNFKVEAEMKKRLTSTATVAAKSKDYAADIS